MSTVKLVDESSQHPKVRAVFADIKATKNIGPNWCGERASNESRSSRTLLDSAEGDHAAGKDRHVDQGNHRLGSLGDQRLRVLHQFAYRPR